MKQETISDVEYSARKRKTKREEFLEIMDEIIPWEEWVAYIAPYYPSGKRGRPPKGIEKKSRWRVEYKQYADRKLVAELVAVSEIGSRCTLRLFCFWEQRKAPAFARELKCQA